MKTVTFDSGFTFDDPNLRWGDPSYQLQPGDPGYVAPLPLSTPQPHKTKKMPKSDYLPSGDDAFSAKLITFKNAIAGYATLLGLSPAQVAAQAADADYFAYVLACRSLTQNEAQQWTAWKDYMRDGGTPPVTGIPVATVLPTAVPPVAFGIEGRFRALVQALKAHASYNASIGEALGIEGAEIAGPDLSAVKPVLKLETSGGAVKVRWGWQGNQDFLDMIELQVDRGGGPGYVLLAMDTTPNYIDTLPPTAPAKWIYRGIYRLGDARVGQWSDEVSISVAP